VIDVRAVGQEHIGKGAPVLVEAVSLERDYFPESEVRGGVLGFLAVSLAFLRTVDPAETDAFRVLVVEDFEVVAVEDGDDGAGEVGSTAVN
jgi:hypothetical protein